MAPPVCGRNVRAMFRTAADTSLTFCRSCRSDNVSPIEWTDQGKSGWWMHLRCGSCEASREVEVSDAAAKRYDIDLNRGTREIAASLWSIEREQMAHQAEVFATALRLDLLDAGDFAR
jgi:hypothetical protein